MAEQAAFARNRLGDVERMRFEEAARMLKEQGGRSPAPSDLPLANFFPILSPDIPFVDQRIYHPSVAARLKPSAPRTVVWDVNHTGENHVDPFLEGLELRPDYRTAKAEVKLKGLLNIDWSQAEHWWLDAFFKTNPGTLKSTIAVIAAENYMGMTAAEKKAHPQVAEILKTRPTGKAISFLGFRVIIDDNDAVLPALAKKLGFVHVLVPKAFSNRAAEGDVLTRAAQEAVDHLRRLAAIDDDPHPRLNFWAGILLLAVAAASALLLWYQIAHYWATIEWQVRSSIGIDIDHFFH